MRIIPDPLGQARTQGIGDYVAGKLRQVFLPAQGVIMKTALPDSFPQPVCRHGLNRTHHLRQ